MKVENKFCFWKRKEREMKKKKKDKWLFSFRGFLGKKIYGALLRVNWRLAIELPIDMKHEAQHLVWALSIY